jgi:hypothetical protein
MEINKKKISQAAVLSYFLSILYFILRFVMGNEDMVNYIFIAIHVFFIIFAVLLFFWVYVAIGIGFLSGLMRETDKNNVKLVLKTMPHRIGLSILYWLLPIGLYSYYVFPSSYLYVFVWLPLWFPLMYYFIEKYIKNKEVKIGSPVVKNW